jgi:hypothetical protein
MNLAPAGSAFSGVESIAGGQQAGFANIGGVIRAGTWAGSAATWADLHPAGATESTIFGTNGTRQAGYAVFGGLAHAALWTGTAGSFIDLNPAGADRSALFASFGLLQGGYARFGGNEHAGIWSGTAASFEDIHGALIGNWTSSRVNDIWQDGSGVWAAGHGFNAATARTEAVLWHNPVPEPGTALTLGVLALAALYRMRRLTR